MAWPEPREGVYRDRYEIAGVTKLDGDRYAGTWDHGEVGGSCSDEWSASSYGGKVGARKWAASATVPGVEAMRAGQGASRR